MKVTICSGSTGSLLIIVIVEQYPAITLVALWARVSYPIAPSKTFHRWTILEHSSRATEDRGFLWHVS